MSQHETGVACRLCVGGEIVAEINPVPRQFSTSGVIGREYPSEISVVFHCNLCQALFYHPPGRPNAVAEILTELRQAEERTEEAEFRERAAKLVEKLKAK